MEQVIPGVVIVVALFGLVLLNVRSRKRAEESQQSRLRDEERAERGTRTVSPLGDPIDGLSRGRLVDLDELMVALVFTCPADQVAYALSGIKLPKRWSHNQGYEWYYGQADVDGSSEGLEPDAIVLLEPTIAGCRLSLVSTSDDGGEPAHGPAWEQLRQVIMRKCQELDVAVDELPGPLLAPVVREPADGEPEAMPTSRWVRATA